MYKFWHISLVCHIWVIELSSPKLHPHWCYARCIPKSLILTGNRLRGYYSFNIPANMSLVPFQPNHPLELILRNKPPRIDLKEFRILSRASIPAFPSMFLKIVLMSLSSLHHAPLFTFNISECPGELWAAHYACTHVIHWIFPGQGKICTRTSVNGKIGRNGMGRTIAGDRDSVTI